MENIDLILARRASGKDGAASGWERLLPTLQNFAGSYTLTLPTTIPGYRMADHDNPGPVDSRTNPLNEDRSNINFCITSNPPPWVHITGDVYSGTYIKLPPAPEGARP